MGRTTLKATLGGTPSSKRQEIPPWFKTLEPSHAEAFSHDSDMVREARREFFLKHSYNFTTDGTHDLSGIFRWLAASANLLGTSIHEIKASWMGPEELKQVNYALRSLPKGLKFLCMVSLQNLLRLWNWQGYMTWMPFAAFGGIPYCPWYRKVGQNKGTVVNHLQTVHYRLSLVCSRCHDCPSTTSDTLHCHSQHDCHQSGEKDPSKSVPSGVIFRRAQLPQLRIPTRK